jgi:hypothetical protein
MSEENLLVNNYPVKLYQEGEIQIDIPQKNIQRHLDIHENDSNKSFPVYLRECDLKAMLKFINDNKPSSLNIQINDDTLSQFPNYNKGVLYDPTTKQSVKDICVNYCPDRKFRDITGGQFCNVTYKCQNLKSVEESNHSSCHNCINNLVIE